jgi:hypothetical protein
MRCQKLHVAVRKCIRHMLGVPYRTHSKLLHCILQSLCIDHICQKRFLKFSYNVLNHSSETIRFIFKLAMSFGQSIFAKKCCIYCTDNLRISTDDICNAKCEHLAVQMCKNNCVCENDMATACVVTQLLKVREKSLETNMPINMLDVILDYICIH